MNQVRYSICSFGQLTDVCQRALDRGFSGVILPYGRCDTYGLLIDFAKRLEREVEPADLAPQQRVEAAIDWAWALANQRYVDGPMGTPLQTASAFAGKIQAFLTHGDQEITAILQNDVALRRDLRFQLHQAEVSNIDVGPSVRSALSEGIGAPKPPATLDRGTPGIGL